MPDDWRHQYKTATTNASQFKYLESNKQKTNQYIVQKRKPTTHINVTDNKSSDAIENTNWNNLSTDLLVHIFQYCNIHDLISTISLVSKYWYNLVRNNAALWKFTVLDISPDTSDQHILNIDNIQYLPALYMNYRNINRKTHSDGAYNLLLNHISKVAPNLLHLQLRSGSMFDYTLSNIITLRKLQSLDLTDTYDLTDKGISTICHNLSQLCTLKLGCYDTVTVYSLTQLNLLQHLTTFEYSISDPMTMYRDITDAIIHQNTRTIQTICQSTPLLEQLKLNNVAVTVNQLQIIKQTCHHLRTLFCSIEHTLPALYTVLSINTVHKLYVSYRGTNPIRTDPIYSQLMSTVDVQHIQYLNLLQPHTLLNSDWLLSLHNCRQLHLYGSIRKQGKQETTAMEILPSLRIVTSDRTNYTLSIERGDFINVTRQENNLPFIKFETYDNTYNDWDQDIQ